MVHSKYIAGAVKKIRNKDELSLMLRNKYAIYNKPEQTKQETH